jgi:hypothetical protein
MSDGRCGRSHFSGRPPSFVCSRPRFGAVDWRIVIRDEKNKTCLQLQYRTYSVPAAGRRAVWAVIVQRSVICRRCSRPRVESQEHKSFLFWDTLIDIWDGNTKHLTLYRWPTDRATNTNVSPKAVYDEPPTLLHLMRIFRRLVDNSTSIRVTVRLVQRLVCAPNDAREDMQTAIGIKFIFIYLHGMTRGRYGKVRTRLKAYSHGRSNVLGITV